jgi:hypothetical protein
MIVGQYTKNMLCGFFPGLPQEGGTDLSDTSIAISLNINQKNSNFLRERGLMSPTMIRNKGVTLASCEK